MNKLLTSTLVFVSLLIPATLASGQVNLRGPVATSIGGGGAATLNSIDAFYLNPANVLRTDKNRGITLSLGRVSAFAGGDLMQFKYYNEAFTTGSELSPEQASQIIEDWFGDTSDGTLRSAEFGAEAVPLAMTIQNGDWALGLAVKSKTLTKAALSGGWLDLVLVGDDELRDIPMNADLRLMSTTELSAAFSKRLAGGLVTVGVAPKYILGNEFMENVFESTATVTADSIIHEFDYVSRAAGGLGTRIVDNLSFFSPSNVEEESYSPQFLGGAGAGFGVDLGITVHPAPAVHVSASITDIGSVKWNSEAETARPANNTFRFDGLNLDLDELNDRYDGDIVEYAESILDSLARETYEEVITEVGSFSSTLPTALHLGGRFAPFSKLSFTGGTSIPMNRAAGNISRKPSIYAGTEYILGGSFGVPLRAGVHLGGSGALALAAGFGIRTPVYDFDLGFVATPYTNSIGSGGRYSVSLSLVNIKI